MSGGRYALFLRFRLCLVLSDEVEDTVDVEDEEELDIFDLDRFWVVEDEEEEDRISIMSSFPS